MSQIFVEKISLTNFRNLEFDYVEFSHNINCIFGQNGNGKTNLLEAIYFLFTHKSFRKKAGFSQMLSMDSDKAEMTFNSVLMIEGKRKSYSGKWSSLGQQWYLDNSSVKKKIEQVIVLVNPFDASQFYQTPGFRRDWINQYCSHYSSEYKDKWKNYSKLLKMKNSLLSSSAKPKREIRAINNQLSMLNFEILDLRENFIRDLNRYLSETFKNIFDESHHLELQVESKLTGMTIEEIGQNMEEKLEKECVIGHTIFGVHRDDFMFKFNGLNAFDYCSLGQQKMSYLSLLFAYTELFRYKFKTYPIIFVDDISGELDSLRWKRLIKFLEQKKFQVFITTANDAFKKILEDLENAQKIYMEDGQLDFKKSF